MKTTNRALFVAFTSQKGGVGKSTFTTLAASIMHYRLGYNVAIVDCDFPQFSISQMRERDMKMVMENTALKQAVHQQFKSLEKGAYPILKEKAESAIEAAFNLMESKGGLDIIFFDLPGTVNSAGIITTLASMDYLFIPITADRIVLESALVFTQLITDVLMQQENVTIKEAHLFWNQVDGRERNPLYTLYSDFIRSLELNLMNSAIASGVRFRKEGETDTKVVFRSTLLPPDEKLMLGSGLDAFLRELLQLLKI